jgi:hypothetical protein
MTSEGTAPFAALIGEQLSSVEFIQDYVQLRFDGPCLTAFTHPVVHVGTREFHWGLPGYRDALCERIATLVCEVSFREDDAIRVHFQDGATVEISLCTDDYEGPESAMFTTPDGQLWVW